MWKRVQVEVAVRVVVREIVAAKVRGASSAAAMVKEDKVRIVRMRCVRCGCAAQMVLRGG